MKLKVNKFFDTGHSKEKCWGIVSDIEMVVKCLPGASIKEKKSATEYAGQMTIKMGPMNLNFQGNAEVLKMDAVNSLMRLSGSAKDAGFAGNAKLDLSIRLEGTDNCKFFCDANIEISGKMAQYGSRLIQSATNSIFDKFTNNFKLMLNGEHNRIESSLGVGSVLKGMVSGVFKK